MTGTGGTLQRPLRLLALLAALAGGQIAGRAAVAQEATQSAPGAILRVLDKVSGKTQDVTLGTGELASVFKLDIALSECRYPADNPTGDAFAHVTIHDTGAQTPVFEGWMIASAPALNALDHARYDLWVMRCSTS